ncbi:maleylpyruvate isomerase N-terminal domain-containing protein [Cryptosporangium phraense]|uniref:Maleylpyruvate isomerase family protein n=1 Tax=Cryptosporangium phraense TaxID=2593070 RepID=A0A545AWR8_9ACTN|nr:maleylpyruvate isomerase N-terminal domain-containing protein [Cryptosporangium phraense]TQS45772.1 maleylpyruvate isomerase family protein [Cryptosporangium phraense]
MRAEIEDALERAHSRFVASVRATPAGAGGRTVPACPEWSVADLVAHVLTVYRRALGDRRRSRTPEETAALNATVLAETPERDLAVLASLLEADGPASFAVLRGFPDDLSFRFHGGGRTTVTPVSAVILGELLIHGHDLAEATGGSWTIPPDEASLVLRGASAPGPDGYPPIFAAWLAPGGEKLLAAVTEGDDPVGTMLALYRRTAPTTPSVTALAPYLRSL